MPAPAVSVIITSYNRAAYLREAVDSILKQTFSDYEIIIVDDGSADDTPQVTAEYAGKYGFITVIAQKNAGVSAARTAGVNKARGEFIAFQDDDDIAHPDRLKRQVEELRARPDMAACVTNFAPIGETQGAARKDKTRWMWQGTGHVFRRDVYLAVGGYRSYFRVAEDVDFFLMFDEKHQYHFIDEVLYYYRRYAPGKGGNITNSPPLQKFPYAAAAFVSAHCRRSGQPDPVAQNIAVDKIAPRMAELPADMRLRLLHVIRNSGRIILARKEASAENMRRIREYLELLGGGECLPKAKKYRHWLAWQALRYGQPGHIKLFLSAVK